MKVGDHVRIHRPYPADALEAVVTTIAEHGNSIVLTVQTTVYAHRENAESSWIDLETGEPFELHSAAD